MDRAASPCQARAGMSADEQALGGMMSVRLQLSEAGPMAGTVHGDGDEIGTVFHGWIELMMALETVRAQSITVSGDAGGAVGL